MNVSRRFLYFSIISKGIFCILMLWQTTFTLFAKAFMLSNDNIVIHCRVIVSCRLQRQLEQLWFLVLCISWNRCDYWQLPYLYLLSSLYYGCVKRLRRLDCTLVMMRIVSWELFPGLQPGQVRESISFAHSGETIKIKSPIDCQDSNLLYELHCKKDSLPYLGETSKTAEARFVGHLNTILQDCHSNTKTPVGQHFRSAGHSHTDIQVTAFEKIKSRNPFVRKAREAFLIDKHQLLNNGLNKILWS